MKTKHFLFTGALALAFAGLILTGCQKKKKSTAPTANDYAAAQDDANALFVIEDTKNISDGAAKGQASDRVDSVSPCSTIFRRDTVINSVKDTLYDIFFGTNDCTCTDGRTRRGHVLVWCHPGQYFTQGDTIGMGFKNYYVSDIGVTGTRQLINVGTDSAGLHTWSFSANLTLTYPNSGGTATWTSNRTNTLTNIGGKWYYSITGSAGGTSRKGDSYSINITSPIYVTAFPWWYWLNPGCRYIESGKLTITVSSYTYPIYVSFGTGVGNCSSAMTVTINSQVYNLTQL